MTTATKTFTPTILADDDMLEECPMHGAAPKREYDFGMNDATVTTFRCGCAAVVNHTSEEATLYPSYEMASGRARMIVAQERAFTNRYGI